MRFRSPLSRPAALLLASSLLAACGARSSLSPAESEAPPEAPRVCPPASTSDTWNRSLGQGDAVAPRVLIDADGNLVVAVIFHGTIDFGCETFTAAEAERDILLAKLDPRGRLLWAHHLGGSGYYATNLEAGLDGSGRIVLTGAGAGAPLNLGDVTLAAGNFVASFDPSGKLLWAHDLPGAKGSQDADFHLAVSAKGRVVLGGSHLNTIDIGLGPIAGTGSEERLVLVAGWDDDGTPRFSYTLPGDADRAFSIAFAKDESAVLVGSSGNGPFNGPSQPLAAKLAADGAILWQQSYPMDSPELNTVALDPSGDLLVTGRAATLPQGVVFSGISGVDGHPLWSRGPIANLGPYFSAPFVPLPDGRLLLAGGFTGTLDVGEGPVSEAGGGDACLLTFDAAGEGGHVQRFGDIAPQTFDSVGIDPSGHPIVIGRTAADFDLGASGVVASSCHLGMCLEIFIARLPP